MKTLFALFFGALLVCGAAQAAEIRLLGGPENSTAQRMAEDLARVGEPQDLSITAVASAGSQANLRQLQSNPKGDLAAVVRADAVTDADARGLIRFHALHQSVVHLVASPRIKDVAALDGASVIVGAPGSDDWITATALFRAIGIHPRPIEESADANALAKIANGEADAMLITGLPGQALPLDPAALQASDGSPALHLLSLPFDKLPENARAAYRPAALGTGDYPWLTAPVRSVAVQVDLAAHTAFSKNQCYLMDDLIRLIDTSLDELGAAPQSPWQQVRPKPEDQPWKPGDCFFQQASDGVDALGHRNDLSLKTRVALGIARNRLEKATQAAQSNGGQFDWRAMKALEALEIALQRAAN